MKERIAEVILYPPAIHSHAKIRYAILFIIAAY